MKTFLIIVLVLLLFLSAILAIDYLFLVNLFAQLLESGLELN